MSSFTSRRPLNTLKQRQIKIAEVNSDDIWSFQGRTPPNVKRPGEDNIEYEESQVREIEAECRPRDLRTPTPSRTQNYLASLFKTPSKTPPRITFPGSGSSSRKKKKGQALKQLTSVKLFPRSGTPGFQEGKQIRSSKRRSSFCEDFEDTFSDVVDENVGSLSQLESSIVVEGSPAVKKKRRSLRQLALSAAASASPVPTQNRSFVDINSDLIQVDESEAIHICSQISNIPSTQQSQPEQVGGEEENDDLTVIPRRSPRLALKSPSAKGKSEPKKSLLESFKDVLAQHELAVRRFSHDLRNGKYDDTATLDLIVRKVLEVDKYEKTVKAVVYDVKEKKDRWVWFYALNPPDIHAGACVKLYKPWHEMTVGEDSVITGADFFKIVPCKKWNLDKQQIQEIVNLPIPKAFVGFPEPILLDLVPYHIKNNATVQKQTFMFKTSIKVHVAILNVWKYASGDYILCLIKDSDELLSFLEIPREYDDFLSVVASGSYFKLKNLRVRKKINVNELLPPFSVLYSFGVVQTFVYCLRWESNSKWKPVAQLEISINESKQKLLNLEFINLLPAYQDQRVVMNCEVKEVKKKELLVCDLLSERSLKIGFVVENDYYFQQTPNCQIQIQYLRLIQGRAIWDQYTTYGDITDD